MFPRGLSETDELNFMPVVVCTLFENQYHPGLAALVNSLFANGYQGDVYVGYKGGLPPWADAISPDNALPSWQNEKIFSAGVGLNLHFLPIDKDIHLANYKPTFMLELFEGLTGKVDGIIYFDPDIVVRCRWSFFETWISYGVALVHEVISNDMPATHPVRMGWRRIIESNNRKVTHGINSYINSGFAGVTVSNIEFLHTWCDIITIAEARYGYNIANFTHMRDRSNLFYANDQDALNVAAMCCESPISEMGPEGMDFINGGWTMSHAVGTPKPWNKKYLLAALKGNAPGKADKAYWNNVLSPVKCFNSGKVKRKKAAILAAAFIGRFYKRN